jgi:HemK-related putative methylase
MRASISILKKRCDTLGYADIQYYPSQRADFVAYELRTLGAFLFKNRIAIFDTSALYPLYVLWMKLFRPRLYQLYRMLFLHKKLSADELTAVFDRKEIEKFIHDGVLSVSGDTYRFTLAVYPIGKLTVVAPVDQNGTLSEGVYIGCDTLYLWNAFKDELTTTNIDEALEIGCGTGFLSLRLSGIAGHVTATDVHQKAVDSTRLNAEINGTKNITTVVSDLYADIGGRYDLILSNPPYMFLPDDYREYRVGYGGSLGMQTVLGILDGLERYLKEDGRAYVLANSYIRENGEDTLESAIRQRLEHTCLAVTMRQLYYCPIREHRSFYQKHKIAHSILYLLKMTRADTSVLTKTELKGFARITENLKLRVIGGIPSDLLTSTNKFAHGFINAERRYHRHSKEFLPT